jgi:hypothetical protein
MVCAGLEAVRVFILVVAVAVLRLLIIVESGGDAHHLRLETLLRQTLYSSFLTYVICVGVAVIVMVAHTRD